MRTKLALMFAVLVGLGSARADVVNLTNVIDGSNTTTLGSLFIKLTTTGSGAFQLTSLQLSSANNNSGIGYQLTLATGGAINAISGSNLSATAGLITFNNSNTFGAGDYWLAITGLSVAYGKGVSSTLTASPSDLGVSNALLVAAQGDTSGTSGDIFKADLQITVPEPATLILTGSALAAGAVGAFFKRRRKVSTEVAA